MNSPVVTQRLTKTFGRHAALRSIDLEVPASRVVGLLGRNGAGKTTLLNIACGLVLPTDGSCETLGTAVKDLGSTELAQIGLVPQEARLIAWMRVGEHLAFNAAFYRRWDTARENRLLKELELPLDRKVGQLSTGDRQKLSVILSVCHHPSLLLLDEPVSALDPIIRGRMLDFLLSVVREDNCTVVISSHILTDLEKIIDWVVCLDQGGVAVSAPLDEIQESHAEWIVTSPEGSLPGRFPEPFVLSCDGDSHQARLRVRSRPDMEQAFSERYHAEVVSRPLALEQLFPLLIKDRGGPQVNIPSLRIIRPTRLCMEALQYTGLLAFFWVFGLFLAPVNPMVQREGTKMEFFFLVALLLPLGVGVALAQTFHEVFRNPFCMLLPSARRLLAAGQSGLVVAIGAAIAFAAHFVQARVPAIAAFGLAVGALSLWTPFGSGMHWKGALAVIALFGLLVYISFHPWQLSTLLVRNDFIVCLAGIGVGASCLSLGYSRERLRARAMPPQPSLLPGSDRTALNLPGAPADGSIRAWVRLVFHEYYGQGSSWVSQILLIPLIMFLIFLGFGCLIAEFQLSFGVQSTVGLVVVLSMLIWTSHWPKMDALYPISRLERFGIVAIWSIAQELLVLVTLLLSIAGMEWGVLLAGGNNHGARIFTLGATLMVPLIGIPMMQWAALFRSRRQALKARALWLVSWCVFVIGIGIWPRLSIAAFSLANLALAALAIVSHVIYFQGLRRICQKADLVFQSAG